MSFVQSTLLRSRAARATPTATATATADLVQTKREQAVVVRIIDQPSTRSTITSRNQHLHAYDFGNAASYERRLNSHSIRMNQPHSVGHPLTNNHHHCSDRSQTTPTRSTRTQPGRIRIRPLLLICLITYALLATRINRLDPRQSILILGVEAVVPTIHPLQQYQHQPSPQPLYTNTAPAHPSKPRSVTDDRMDLFSWLDRTWQSLIQPTHRLQSIQQPSHIISTNRPIPPATTTPASAHLSLESTLATTTATTASTHSSHTSRMLTATSVDTSSSTINNPGPLVIPPARLSATIADLGDGAHWGVSILYSTGNSTGNPLLPDSTARTIQLVIDTGSADLIIFNKTGCATSDTSAYCNNALHSHSFVKASYNTARGFQVSLDGEGYSSSTSLNLFGPGGSIGKDLIGLGQTVLGTSQTEYDFQMVDLFVTDGSIGTLPADYQNIDNDPLTSALINVGYYDRADGVLGLAFLSQSTVASTIASNDAGVTPAVGGTVTGFQELIGQSQPFFALDFTDGQFNLGGINEQYRTRLSWSDGPASDLVPGYHSFHLYHLSICGVDMFQNLTSSWHAIIDTGSSCLGLPAELFDMVISWSPLKCNLGHYDQLPHQCYLSDQVKPYLPTISFKLAESGTTLYISLSDLLFPSAGVNRICLYRGYSILGGPTGYNPIVFGARIIKQFYAAFDMSTGLVGFAQKSLTLTDSRVQCATRVQCQGMQVRYDPLNMCLPPPCSDYYFFAYDSTTKACKLTTGFHIMCGILIGLFILAELILNELIIFLSNKVQQNGIVAGG